MRGVQEGIGVLMYSVKMTASELTDWAIGIRYLYPSTLRFVTWLAMLESWVE